MKRNIIEAQYFVIKGKKDDQEKIIQFIDYSIGWQFQSNFS